MGLPKEMAPAEEGTLVVGLWFQQAVRCRHADRASSSLMGKREFSAQTPALSAL